MKHVISWSGGKDSTATVILFHEHEKELMKDGDEVVILFIEVMYDLARNISGHNPDIIKFIYEKKKIFESWGYKVEILHSDKDFQYCFHHIMEKNTTPDRIGRPYGFPVSGICSVKRDCKKRPKDNWVKEHSFGGLVEYVGIAIDEAKRLESIKKKGCISLLERYGLTEDDAMKICREHDLLSPQYDLDGQKRDGCWFCPNAKLCEHKAIKEKMPNVWYEYVSLENIPNLGYPKWNCYSKETLHQRNELLEKGYYQMSIFDYIERSI